MSDNPQQHVILMVGMDCINIQVIELVFYLVWH